MAAVIDAGQRTNEPATNARRAQAFEIRKIEIADVQDCIAEGVRDFGRALLYGMFFGAIYAVGGVMIVWFAFAMDYPYLAYPLTIGFALFAPFVAAATYEISRRLESGEPLSWVSVTGAVCAGPGGSSGGSRWSVSSP